MGIPGYYAPTCDAPRGNGLCIVIVFIVEICHGTMWKMRLGFPMWPLLFWWDEGMEEEGDDGRGHDRLFTNSRVIIMPSVERNDSSPEISDQSRWPSKLLVFEIKRSFLRGGGDEKRSATQTYAADMFPSGSGRMHKYVMVGVDPGTWQWYPHGYGGFQILLAVGGDRLGQNSSRGNDDLWLRAAMIFSKPCLHTREGERGLRGRTRVLGN